MAGKFKIKGIKKNLSLFESSRIINKYRYNNVKKRIKKYLGDRTKENLHELRISIRRLRYTLENFRACYSETEFLIVIEYIKFLQDLIGEARDLDVLPEKIHQIEKENQISISEKLYSLIEVQKKKVSPKISLELDKFNKNKTLIDFFVSKKRK